MDISTENINLKLTLKFFLSVFVTTLMFSCGPRTGIHEENSTSDNKANEKPMLVCGNAFDNTNKNKWAERNLTIKGDAYKGEKLFKQNCAVCHSINDQKLTGPGLAGVLDRVPRPAEEYLMKYILNNEKLLKSGDAYAKKVHSEYGTLMTVFEGQLTEQDVKDIIVYVVGVN